MGAGKGLWYLKRKLERVRMETVGKGWMRSKRKGDVLCINEKEEIGTILDSKLRIRE